MAPAGESATTPTADSTNSTTPDSLKPVTKMHKPKTPNSRRKCSLEKLATAISSVASAGSAFLTQNDLQLLPSQSLSLEALLSSNPIPPSLSSSPASNNFRGFLSSSSDFDTRWLEFFRMSKPTFTHLLSQLSSALISSLPTSIPPESAVAASLFRLAHGASYKSVARRFGLDSSEAACLAFYTFCKAVNQKLGDLYEVRRDVERIVVGFGWISLPNCCGVLGFGQFGIDCKLTGKNGSILVQALVDSEGRFLDISAGWPSSMTPTSIFKQTKLYSDVEEAKELLNGPSYELGNGDSIRQYVLGDSCFPLLSWLLTPNVKPVWFEEMEFNAVHSRAMELVNNAFRRVKTRWQLLARKWKEDCVEFLPFVIVMGCVLHNFLTKCNESLPDESLVHFPEEKLPVSEDVVDENGQRTRNVLARHLSRVSTRRA